MIAIRAGGEAGCGLKMNEYQNDGVLECWSAGVLECWTDACKDIRGGRRFAILLLMVYPIDWEGCSK